MRAHLSGTLLRFTNYKKSFELDAATVGDALRTLVVENPDLAPVLFDGAGQLRKLHRVFLNSEQLFDEDLGRVLAGDDDLEIVTAIAGG